MLGGIALAIMACLEGIIIIVFRNLIFQNKIYKSFNVVIPVSILMFVLSETITYTIPSIAVFILILLLTLALKFNEKIGFYRAIVEVVIGFLVMIIGECVALGIAMSIWGDFTFKFIIVVYSMWSILIAILLKFPKKYLTDFDNALKRNKTIILLIIDILPVAFVCKVLFDNHMLVGNIGLQIILLICVFFVLTLSVYRGVILEVKEQDKLRVENSFRPILDDYMNKLRANEHEYKNHLNAIYGMIMIEEENQIKEKVQKYISSIKKSENLNKLLHVDNTILRAVLYSKLSESEQEGIRTECDINSNLKKCSIDNTDLVILISNILNNAFEACKESADPWVKISINESSKDKRTKYNICVENSVEDINKIDISAMMKKGYSTKGIERGFGLENVNKIVKSINGKILIEPKESSIAIQLEI